jgi:hypothetical protein
MKNCKMTQLLLLLLLLVATTTQAAERGQYQTLSPATLSPDRFAQDTCISYTSIDTLFFEERLPLIAVRTNLVHDFFYMPNFGFASSPNLQLEYFPLRGHYTFNLGFTFSNHRHWNNYKFFQIRDLQLEVRRYFKEGHPYRGGFLGVYAHGFAYGIGFNENKGWEGEGGGAGISGGYTLKLNRRGNFRLELTAAVGFFLTKYDPYVYGNPQTGTKDGKYYYDYMGKKSQFKKRNQQFTWLGPTNLGIQLTYDLIYRKKGGAK